MRKLLFILIPFAILIGILSLEKKNKVEAVSPKVEVEVTQDEIDSRQETFMKTQ